MKTVIYLFALIFIATSCNKIEVDIRESTINQSSQSNVSESIFIDEMEQSGEWQRNDVGIYQLNIDLSEYDFIEVNISPTSNINQHIKYHVTDEYIQIYTYDDYNNEKVFSDDVLINTTLIVKGKND